MATIKQIEKKGTDAVKELRLVKLQNGHPFMINSRDLPGTQCYLEYPDGSITLVSIAKSARDFTFIRKLSPAEQNSIRATHNLLSA